MGSSSKSGSSRPNYDYFGTILIGVCYGPADKLFALLLDGKAVWGDPAGTERSGNSLDVTSAIDAKYFTTNGKGVFYWGTATQTVDPLLAVVEISSGELIPGNTYVVKKNNN